MQERRRKVYSRIQCAGHTRNTKAKNLLMIAIHAGMEKCDGDNLLQAPNIKHQMK